jgi:hypothetical protein
MKVLDHQVHDGYVPHLEFEAEDSGDVECFTAGLVAESRCFGFLLLSGMKQAGVEQYFTQAGDISACIIQNSGRNAFFQIYI